MKRVRNERGGMTLYALLAAVSCFTLVLGLSDLVRARLGASEAEAEARRIGRAALSSFEPGLLEYGLFGTSGKSTRMGGGLPAGPGLRAEADVGGFPWYDAAKPPAALEIEPFYHLGDHRVFRRQVLERMKFIAPIEFGIHVAQKLAAGKQQLAAAQQYAALSKTLQDALERREVALDQAWSIAQRIARSAGAAGGSLQPSVSDLQTALSNAERANDELRKQLNAPAPRAPNGPETTFPHVSVYPSSYFGTYLSGAATVASMHAAWLALEGEEDGEEGVEERERRREELREDVRTASSEWLSARSAAEADRERERGNVRRMEAEQRQAAERQLSRRRDNWKDYCTVDTFSDYMTLTGPEGLFEKYRVYNEHLASGGMQPEMDEGDADAYLTASLDFTDRIARAVAELRDETYLNEFAVTHFTFRTSEKQKYAAKVKTRIGNASSHRLQGQEAEYILYGLPTCHLNLSAMHAELFALRTGLRTLEALLAPESAAKAASPMVALLTALAEGAKKANDDADVLLSGEAVEIPFVPGAVMDYKDHLRLFYLLHSRNESTMSRMQALIELNTGIDLTERYTAVRVRTTVPVRRSLLPFAPREATVVESY
ncbi:hypothetical protein [Paenibacillus sp.]|uniref:hypothetical protein n=1 Tax=Paenibacillus sp. TaxID=58172 RepID=UPI002D28D9E5|nr:hypothetical protein [Paenibacillus sp.]HZG56024.1 hypothetical protein [Paenibacillus sp.]